MDWNCLWLNERQFVRFGPHLPTGAPGKPPRADDRPVIRGIVHILKSGCRWIDVDIFYALASADGPPTEVLIDSSAVKARFEICPC